MGQLVLSEKSEACTSGPGHFRDSDNSCQYGMIEVQKGSEKSIDIGFVGAFWNWAAMVGDAMVTAVALWYEARLLCRWIHTVAVSRLIMDVEMRDDKILMVYNGMASRRMVG